MEELNGILIVNKEKGYTSHDVVNVVRRILNTRKVGHTGTLDPNAEGVLPICVGKSTKVSNMLMDSDKEYIADIKLGVTSDTYDIWGAVSEQKEVAVTKEQIISATEKFTGEIMQLPPMYSAIKVNGKKLYELARKGIEIERKKRKVTIYKSEILNISGNEFKLLVSCSKGTYIRSLCHDIGAELGCGAVMTALVRTKSSIFKLENSLTLEQIEQKVKTEGASSILKSADSVFMQYDKINVNNTVRKRLLNGAASKINCVAGTYRIYDNEDNFIGIAKVCESQNGNTINIVKAFC